MRVARLMTLLALAGPMISYAAPPVRFDNLPADTEVHAVAVYEPLHSGVSDQEIVDWRGLVQALRAKEGPAAHIRKQLPKETDAVLTEEVEMGRLGDDRPATVKTKVTRRLAGAISDAGACGSLYDESAFAKVELTRSLKELVALGSKRTVFQTARMNRELASLVFGDCLAESPIDYQTVHITIKASKPVVLVTSAYTQTRWVVTVEKGATVAGVIQYGNGAQELVGTDAPVIYRAGIRPDGTKGPVNGFNAWKQDDNEPSYKRIKGEVKELTGQDFASFQGKYQATKEPFVVKPGAK